MEGETDEHRKTRIIEDEKWRCCQGQEQTGPPNTSNECITDKK